MVELLRKLGWSQAELGRRLGVSETTVGRWKARGCPRPVELYLVAMVKLRNVGTTALAETVMLPRGERKAHRLRLEKTAEQLAAEAERVFRKGRVT